MNLLTQAKVGDEGTVAFHILLLQIVEQFATLANHAQQTTTRVVVVDVLFEVAGKGLDVGGQQRDLNLISLSTWRHMSSHTL